MARNGRTKDIYKGTFICIQTLCTVVKSKGKISQNFVAFSEYMNFNTFSPGLKLSREIRGVHIKFKCECDLKGFSPIVNKCSGRCVLSDFIKNDAYQ